jgi:hypothetical protein
MTDADAILTEIKRLYYETSKTTIGNDFARAIDLLKSLPDEAARERATVYMDGLAEMRREWATASGSTRARSRQPGRRPRRR